MELLRFWVLLKLSFGTTTFERSISQILSLALSTGYWFMVAAALTFIVSRIN